MAVYLCRGEDREDLSDEVRRLVKLDRDSPSPPAMFAVRGSRGPRRWEVIVTCSKGHKNVFEGEGEL